MDCGAKIFEIPKGIAFRERSVRKMNAVALSQPAQSFAPNRAFKMDVEIHLRQSSEIAHGPTIPRSELCHPQSHRSRS